MYGFREQDIPLSDEMRMRNGKFVDSYTAYKKSPWQVTGFPVTEPRGVLY